MSGFFKTVIAFIAVIFACISVSALVGVMAFRGEQGAIALFVAFIIFGGLAVLAGWIIHKLGN